MADDGFETIDIHRGDDKIPRDRYDRYLLPHPETGKTQPWTRATTISGSLKDRYRLEKWDQRNIIYGIGQRPSLYAQAAAAKFTDRKTLDGIAKKAKAAADSEAGADLGSALHTFAERIDRGEDVTVPSPYDRDIQAYRTAMSMEGIATALGWIERVVVCPDLGICGTLDRVVNAMGWELPRIGDIKTATDKTDDNGKVHNNILEHGMVDIPLQLGIYANSTHWWDLGKEQWVEMPPVDRDKAMVFHVPAGLGECRVYEVDIAAGWEAVRLALDIRAWRKRKGLYETVISVGTGKPGPIGGEPADGESTGSVGTATGKGGEARSPAEDPPAPPAGSTEIAGRGDGEDGDQASTGRSNPKDGEGDLSHPETRPAPGAIPPEAFEARKAWVAERVNAIKSIPAARSRLAGLWSLRDEVPTYPRGGPVDPEQLSAVIGMCDLVEMEFSMPFGPRDPHPPERASMSERRRARREAEDEAKGKAMGRAQRSRKRTKT